MTVVRFTSSLEGILWAHEYGHTVGLGHRSDGNAIMNATLNGSRNEVTSDECVAFVSRAINNPFNNSGIDTAAGAAGTTRRAQTTTASATSTFANGRTEFDSRIDANGDLAALHAEYSDVASFVRTTYIHGTPVDQAERFRGEENVEILVNMLADERESDHWGNIVFTLGVIGGEQEVPHVIDFLEMQSRGRMNWTTVRQATAGLMGLGYLANRTASSEAINYLAMAAQLGAFDGVQQVSDQTGQASIELNEMADVLSSSAAIGLAMVGSEEALLRLEEIYKTNAPSDRPTAMVPLEELIDLNLDIQDSGIENYFKR